MSPDRFSLFGRFDFRGGSLVIAAASALLSPCSRGEPLPARSRSLVTGIVGATFATHDLAAIRHYYGDGAGFSELGTAPGSARFRVGSAQWLKFEVPREPTSTRRLISVTLETPDLGETVRALRSKGVAVEFPGGDPTARSAWVTDPAGNRIELTSEAGPSASEPAGSGFSQHLQHVGFGVDRHFQESTLAFYRDILGLSGGFQMTAADGRLTLRKLRIPGARNEVIELIFFDPPLNKWAAGAMDHVCLEVADIDAAYASLHLAGLATEKRHRPTVNAEHLWAIDIFDPELTRLEIQVLSPAMEPIGSVSSKFATGPEVRLFNGKTLSGWEGNTGNWRVEDGAIVAGDLARKQPYNEFLATTSDYGDFDLSLQYKIEGTGPFVNGGVQFWSQRVPGGAEMSGYQADLGAGTDGNLYDESRRNRNLAEAEARKREGALVAGGWNTYRIRAEGSRIQIWLNGVRTVDFTETDPRIERNGKFALQIHGSSNTKVWYRGLVLVRLPDGAQAAQ